MNIKQDMTADDLMVAVDYYADEVLRDYVNATSGNATRARAMVVTGVIRLFEKLGPQPMRQEPGIGWLT